jgi:hypothetical protein
MRYIDHILYAVLLFMLSPCEAGTLWQLASPDKQHHLLVLGAPSPDSPDVVRTSFSIADAQGKVIKEVGSTEFPVIAVKWHRDAKALMVIEHIARQVVMRLIAFNGGEWQMSEVTQFKEPPNFFNLVNTESREAAFVCYYLGRNERGGAFVAYRTEVNTQTGEVNLVSAKRIEDADLGFYKSSIASELHSIDQSLNENGTRYSSALSDDEPSWFKPGSVRAPPNDAKQTPSDSKR